MDFNSTFPIFGFQVDDRYTLQTEKKSVVNVKNMVFVCDVISSLRSPVVMVHWVLLLKSAIICR